MSFRDFNDEGPGTFGWDYVLGGNTTGHFRATVNEKLTLKYGLLIVDLVEMR